MYRQSASRSHRSKGFKVKHVLQICVLVAVCYWLIYQVTRSNDKKKEFDYSDVKISEDAQKDNKILKFGRKDLNPQVNKKAKDTEKHDEEVEEEIVEEEDEKHEEEIVEEEEDKHEEEIVEEEEDKHEEEDQKEDHETQKKEIESREGGNDEEDEHNQEKPDPDVDREFIDDEKEIEEEGEKESEEKDIEDNERQTENENSLEDHDHDKEIRNTREEHYKGDDASSAVTHGLPVNTENENGSVENHVNIVDNENKGNITEESYVGQNTTDFKLQETTESGTLTVDEEKGDDVDPTFEGSSSPNSTTASGSDDKPESSNDSIISDTSYSQNVTGGTVPAEGFNFQSLPLEQTDNSSIAVDNNSQLDLNLTTSNASDSVEENTNSVTNSHLVASEYSTQSNVSAETKDDSESHSTEVKTDVRTDGDNESSDSNSTENTDEVQHDNFDSSESSIPLDEKGIHVDLDTLPDIRTEGSNSEEAAEE